MELNPQLVISAGSIVVSILGSYFAIKYKLDSLIDTVKALHLRLDEFEDLHHRLDKEVGINSRDIADLRAFKHKEGDTMNAFKMAKELLQEEREDRGGR